MQPNQQPRRFTDAPQQQSVYRFPQNQPQPYTPAPACDDDMVTLPRKELRELQRRHRKRRRKVFTLWNLFAVIGILTVSVQAFRYVLIPLLVYLNAMFGGVQ